MTDTSFARNYSLDAARGILMMLGAVLHAANIYSTSGGWLLKDGEGSQSFDLIIQSIHVFRMPAFFWISGYFCALTFTRSGSDGLLRKRLPRILVPLLATWITLNACQLCFLAWINKQDVIETLLTGIPLYHLWFLIDLMVFILVAAIVLPKLPTAENINKRINSLPTLWALVVMSFLSIFASLLVRSTGIAYDQIFQLTTLYRLATYGPFFAVGIYMYKNQDVHQKLLRVPVSGLVLAVPVAAIAQTYSHYPSALVREFASFVEIFMAWVSVAAVLRLFHELVKKDSPLTRFLSDSAYTVYLFHHVFVVLVGFVLIEYSFGSWLKFLIVCTASLGGSMLIHVKLVRRNRAIRFLFNGK